jgi:protein-tyrosine-phosphatase
MHRRSLQRNYPEAADKVYLLTEIADREGNIDDPVYGTRETYRATVEELEELLEGGFEKIVELATSLL